jgi:hypothetical protein
MNTIQITNATGQVINYTETEVQTFMRKAEVTDELQKLADNYQTTASQYRKTITEIRNAIHDFFQEGTWDGTETVCERDDVNRLLESIGANKLIVKYVGTFTVTARFEIEAEDEQEAENLVRDGVSMSADFDYMDEEVDVVDIEVYE